MVYYEATKSIVIQMLRTVFEIRVFTAFWHANSLL
jgi:hypothetical protein